MSCRQAAQKSCRSLLHLIILLVCFLVNKTSNFHRLLTLSCQYSVKNVYTEEVLLLGSSGAFNDQDKVRFFDCHSSLVLLLAVVKLVKLKIGDLTCASKRLFMFHHISYFGLTYKVIRNKNK